MLRFLPGAIALFVGTATLAAPLEILTEENPPLNFTRNGELTGTGTQVIREMVKRGGLDARLAVMSWEQAFARAGKENQVCVYSTVRNPQREKQFQWVGPVAQGSYSVFALADFSGSLTRVDELKAYRIATVGDARAAFLRESGVVNLVESPDDAALPKRLTLDRKKAGGADLWMAQHYGAVAKAKAAGVEVKPVLKAILTRPYWLACNPGVSREVIEKLRSALSSMRSDGSYNRLSDAEQLQ